MNCLMAEERFSACLEDELDYQTIREFEAHLANCSSCQTEYATFRKSVKFLQQMPRIEPSFDFDRNLQSMIANSDVDKVPSWHRILNSLRARPVWAFGGIAAILLLALVGLNFYRSSPNTYEFPEPRIAINPAANPDYPRVERIDAREALALPARRITVPLDFGAEYSIDYSIRGDAMPRAPQHTQQNYILRTYDYSFVSSGGGL